LLAYYHNFQAMSNDQGKVKKQESPAVANASNGPLKKGKLIILCTSRSILKL
jgi:hypothetical protein